MSKLLPKAQTLAEIYILSLSLVDRLDQLEGTNVMKHSIKHYSKKLITEIEKLDVEISALTKLEFIDLAISVSKKVDKCLIKNL